MDPFIAEIRPFAFTFAPQGWAMCNGQLMAISQNTALFSLIGTFYGGNGTSNYALPNLQGSTVMSSGQGPGLSYRNLGEVDGNSGVTLLASQLPPHNHSFTAYTGTGQQMQNAPSANCHLAKTLNQYDYSNASANTTLAPTTIGVAGGGQPHENRQPYLALNFCIAMQGVYPARS